MPPFPGVDEEWINIYLNGQVLAALMHQRKILNFHASSFIHNNKGVILLGETGAGKSSLTAAFVLSGAGFLSDDFTPVIFEGAKPLIWPVYKKIKLRENTIRQLGIPDHLLSGKEKVTGKYFLQVDHGQSSHFPLDVILKVEIGEVPEPQFIYPSSAESFTLLRSEVCSWEFLAAMPETETAYLQQLLEIVHQVPVIRVVRPVECDVKELYQLVKGFLKNKLSVIR